MSAPVVVKKEPGLVEESHLTIQANDEDMPEINSVITQVRNTILIPGILLGCCKFKLQCRSE